ncbi:MAG: DUF502 domain-containing protein [Gammaproteobacteria bacterium]|nr:DUF502 domain-containing protein [Gammaproteobacteria bacterium]
MRKTFLRGLITVLPISLTVVVIAWLLTAAENFLGGMIRWLLPVNWYVPGMGVVLAIALIFMVGLTINAYLVKILVGWGESLIERIPLVKSVYSAAQDFIKFIYNDSKKNLQQVVLVKITDDIKIMGFITKQSVLLNNHDYIAVYTPMSYQIGGYTLYTTADRIEALDIPMDKAMRMVLTANI